MLWKLSHILTSLKVLSKRDILNADIIPVAPFKFCLLNVKAISIMLIAITTESKISKGVVK